jgi:4-diphosphocytidyl-2-C-methyl-D-erythritol kinase
MTEKLRGMQVLAPAKINFWLKVTSRRDDGFHDIETLIAPISLYDKIVIERQRRWIDFTCDDPSIPRGDENLVVKAARKFLAATNIKSGLAIQLQKQIPHGAGLGGGSSDAASTLIGLNQLFETKLPREALAEIAVTIGSDVSFFLFNSAALCKGRGEVVTPTRLDKQLSIFLAKPAFSVSTDWAYSRWQHSRELPGACYAAQEFADHNFVNDLERPVFEKYVFLAELKTWLLKQAEVGAALMTGSGSTVFAVLREHVNTNLLARRAKAELDPELWTCACKTLGGSSSPGSMLK